MAVSLLSQNKEFVLNAKLQTADRDGQKAYLHKLDYNSPYLFSTVDSTVVTNGKFSFSGLSPEKTEMRVVEIGNKINVGGNLIGFFVPESGIITLTIDNISHVVGGSENKKLQDFEDNVAGQMAEMEKLQGEFTAISDSGSMTAEISREFEDKGRKVIAQMTNIAYDFTKSNATNGIGEFFFIYHASQFSPEQQKSLYDLFSPAFKETDLIKAMAYRGGWLGEKFSIGQKFEGIDLMTLKGNTENVSDYIGKGKVVLIDFWASWCGPCRKDMPKIVSLYDKYKDRGFEIVGISLDNDEDAWKSGISVMNMTWPQFSDLGGWKGKAANTYGVNRIPMTFLLDRDGAIVAMDLRDTDLENKIEELLTGN